MMIINLGRNDINDIVSLMQENYVNLNAHLGTSYYKTDINVLHKYIEPRVIQQGPIYYFGIKNKEGKLVGLINYMDNRENKKLDIWMLIGSLEHKGLLLDHCIELFKKNNYKYFSCEVFDNDGELISILEEKGVKKLSNNYFL